MTRISTTSAWPKRRLSMGSITMGLRSFRVAAGLRGGSGAPRCEATGGGYMAEWAPRGTGLSQDRRRLRTTMTHITHIDLVWATHREVKAELPEANAGVAGAPETDFLVRLPAMAATVSAEEPQRRVQGRARALDSGWSCDVRLRCAIRPGLLDDGFGLRERASPRRGHAQILGNPAHMNIDRDRDVSRCAQSPLDPDWPSSGSTSVRSSGRAASESGRARCRRGT